MIKAKIKFPNTWDPKDQIAIIGTPETPHAEDLADIYIKDSDYKEPLTVIHVKIVNEQVITRIYKQLNINYQLQ